MPTIKTGFDGKVVLDNTWETHLRARDGACSTLVIDKSKPTFSVSVGGTIVGQFTNRFYAEMFFAAVVDDLSLAIPDDGCRVTFLDNDRPSFDDCMAKFRSGDMDPHKWNFCASNSGPEYGWTAYIMGEGAEQCLASKHGFKSKDEIRELFGTIGVKRVLPI